MQEIIEADNEHPVLKSRTNLTLQAAIDFIYHVVVLKEAVKLMKLEMSEMLKSLGEKAIQLSEHATNA